MLRDLSYWWELFIQPPKQNVLMCGERLALEMEFPTVTNMAATSTDYIATPKRVVLGNINNQGNGSPISPMANLKLLIKVATSHDSKSENSSDMVVLASPEKATEKRSKSKYTRQLRSLGFICKKFLQLYTLNIPSGGQMQLSLVNLAQVLEIEKRRIYDIINVVASLNMAVKVCKDRYIWYGNQHLASMLSKLKVYALQNNLDQLVQSANFLNDLRGHSPNDLVENLIMDPFSTKPTGDHSMIEDNRIGILCQKFVMLFLVSPEGGALNLNVVSKLILPRDIQDKTGMRRLYDIANVLESLGLIKRHCVKTFRKPSFVYCGPVLPSNQLDLLNLSSKTCEQPFIENTDSSDSFSSAESSRDGHYHKMHDMLEVVCTELQKIESVKPPSAKKQLFPANEVVDKSQASRFIKAPAHSFRLLCNTITEKPKELESTQNSIKQDLQTLSGKQNSIIQLNHLPKVSLSTIRKESNFPTIRLNKIARPITIYKPLKLTTPGIQNGGIYKAVKQGDTIHLVKL